MQNRAPFNLKYTLVAYNLLMMYLNFHIFKEVSLIYRRSSKKHLGFSLAWTKLLRQRNFENLICCLKGWYLTDPVHIKTLDWCIFARDVRNFFFSKPKFEQFQFFQIQ